MPESFKMQFESGGLREIKKDAQDAAKELDAAAQAGDALNKQVEKAAKRARFPTGPNQKLLDLAEFKRQAALLPPGARREAIEKDLPILQFRADRSRILGERRLGQGETALQQPGLLDLFGELNSLMKARSLGQGIGAGVRLLQHTGGLNIQQKMAGEGGVLRMGSGGAGVAGLGEEAGGAAEMLGGPLAVAIGGSILALGAEVVALKAFGEAIGAAAEDARRFGRAQIESGGTGANIGRLTSMGVPAEQISGASGALRSRLENDQLAQVTAAQLGVRYPGPQSFVRDQNNARILEQTLIGLRKITDAEEQLREARILGVDNMLYLLKVSDRVFDAQMREARAREKIFDPETTQAARDLGADMDLFKQHLEDLRTAFAKPAIGDADKHLAGINAVLDAAGPALATGLGKLTKDVVDGALDAATGGLWSTLGRIGGAGGSTAQDAHTAATDKNTAALEYVARMLMNNDFNASGPGASGAIPAGVNRNPNYQAEQDWTNWRAHREAGPW